MTRVEQQALEQVAVGTRVAADVVDAGGGLLLGAGGVVTERMRQQLARHGVASLPVAVDEAMTAEEQEARRAAVEAQLAERFSCVRGQPLMELLLQAVLRYRQECP